MGSSPAPVSPQRSARKADPLSPTSFETAPPSLWLSDSLSLQLYPVFTVVHLFILCVSLTHCELRETKEGTQLTSVSPAPAPGQVRVCFLCDGHRVEAFRQHTCMISVVLGQKSRDNTRLSCVLCSGLDVKACTRTDSYGGLWGSTYFQAHFLSWLCCVPGGWRTGMSSWLAVSWGWV